VISPVSCLGNEEHWSDEDIKVLMALQQPLYEAQ
jgi:hypothetical protein